MTRSRLHGERHIVEGGIVVQQLCDLEGPCQSELDTYRRREMADLLVGKMYGSESCNSPEICAISVVLPAPFGPITA